MTLAGGAKNAEKVYYTLLANGWTKQSASGVIGNLLWETGGANSKNPTNISGDINPADKSATRHAGKYAYGIVQWDEGNHQTELQRCSSTVPQEEETGQTLNHRSAIC